MKSRLRALLLAALLAAVTAPAMAEERAALDDAQVSVARLIERLIDEGIMSREEAAALVESAREQALAGGEADAPATSADTDGGQPAAAGPAPVGLADPAPGSVVTQAATDAPTVAAAATDAPAAPDEVRVTYIPQFVRDQLKREVKDELRDEVAHNVRRSARREGWGVPAALPDWVGRLRVRGDVRVRGNGTLYDHGNARFVYRDVRAINAAGGPAAAGADAFLETQQDRFQTQARLRVGIDADLGAGVRAGLRLATGRGDSPVTRNLTLGGGGRNLAVLLDRVHIGWSAQGDVDVDARAGRMGRPWLGSDLLWDADLAFEGVSASTRTRLPWTESVLGFVTMGAFPLREVERTSRDAWLFGSQVGAQWRFAGNSYLVGGAGFYRFDNIRGVRNVPGSRLRDYTAPDFVQKGNTLFDIRNDTDSDTALFALASEFDIVDVNVALNVDGGLAVAGTPLTVELLGHYVRNIGFDADDVRARVGQAVRRRNDGYLLAMSVGRPEIGNAGDWRASGSWRYLERDAVLDAFTDSDFHAGGTDAEGWSLGFEYGLTPSSWLQLRYMSADEIDGPPLAIDVLQLDLNARF